MVQMAVIYSYLDGKKNYVRWKTKNPLVWFLFLVGLYMYLRGQKWITQRDVSFKAVYI